jgi:hypothetical protein
VAAPFDSTFKIDNTAGISDEDVAEVIAYARASGVFSDALTNRLASKSRWRPWNRGFLFIGIDGGKENIKVSAGYHGGGMSMDGMGMRFSGEKTAEGWQFKSTGKWIL